MWPINVPSEPIHGHLVNGPYIFTMVSSNGLKKMRIEPAILTLLDKRCWLLFYVMRICTLSGASISLTTYRALNDFNQMCIFWSTFCNGRLIQCKDGLISVYIFLYSKMRTAGKKRVNYFTKAFGKTLLLFDHFPAA